MKIYAICVLKNECDIVEYSLAAATQWADKVIVYDNGSTDGTWEKVLAMKDAKIVPFKQDNKPYSDGLRADIFNHFKNELADNDWWVIQDSDEIYDESPRSFINRQRGYFHHINGKKIDFSFDLKRKDLQFSGDFSKDVSLFTHYTPIAWSEPRAIKHRSKLEWIEKKIWPTHMGLVCEETINIRHYPLRSFDQIKKRWETRKDVRAKGGQSFSHWEKLRWEDYYQKKADELKEVGDNRVFEETAYANEYRQPLAKRLIKLFLHRIGVFK